MLQRTRYTQILADARRRRILDLPMARHGGTPLRCGIVIHGVTATFPDDNATVRFEMAHQINALHGLGHNFDRLSCDALAALRLG